MSNQFHPPTLNTPLPIIIHYHSYDLINHYLNMANYTLRQTNIILRKITMLFTDKSTISMAIFNSKLLNYQRVQDGAPQI